MPRQRLRTVTVLKEDGSAVLVSPDEDLPEDMVGEVNPKAFEPWGGADVDEDLSGLEYDDMTVKELTKEVKRRQEAGVEIEPASNKKADLITALEEDDASKQ